MSELIVSTCGPRVRVEIDVADGLPPAHADANQIEMAILNLAVNARGAMPSGGLLTIAAKLERPMPGRLASLDPSPHVRLSVTDTGIGMDEAALKRAVEPFFSTKGIGQGTGLGLSMVHGLPLQLGGAIDIASSPGLGTRLDLWLPTSEWLAEMHKDSLARSASETASAGTVLVVDDEEAVRTSVGMMLAELG